MSFFASTEFLMCAASVLGGAFLGYWLHWMDMRRENRRAMRTRQPQYIEVPFVGHGGRQVETLTCDRRR